MPEAGTAGDTRSAGSRATLPQLTWLEILQRAERQFDPVPFDAEAARLFGRIAAAVVAAGRKPGRRLADLMIAATATAEGLPLYTTNPDDFTGLDGLLRVISVTRPTIPYERDGSDLARS